MLSLVAIFALATVSASIGEAEAAGKFVELSEPKTVVDLSLIQLDAPQRNDYDPESPSVGYVQIDSATFQVNFRVINSGTTDVENVKISVHSDLETVNAKLQGKLDPKHSIISVMVKASDPTSIDAKIVGYEI